MAEERVNAPVTRLIHVSHLPPGTSKWIEHRLFSIISQNWRGQPLLTHATIVKLIANTILDRRRYPKDVRIGDEQMTTVRLRPDSFHGDWNYAIEPPVARLCHLSSSRRT